MNPTITKSEPEAGKQSPAATAWGTWKELLLAYAVNRYGTKNWDSISSELRKRTSDSIHLTPHCCEQKYDELKRRFNQSDDNDVVWLDELRKLRVLELERELRNCDLYISSLQTKVKKLTEESEKSGGDTNRKSDLENIPATNDSPEPAVSGDGDSDRENQSVNGSNGNLDNVEKSENGNGNGVIPATGDRKPELAAVIIPVREDDSCDGEPEGNEPVKSEPGESIDESKSSASESRNDRVPRGSDDECTDSIPVRSLPLVDFLHKVQKMGSVVFERRLDRQEKLRYKNLIKQHIDYETLQTRLKQGKYSDGNDKFFRDLLLLVNNTRIFFPKQSPESTAAVDLRHLILNEMTSKKKHKTDSKLTHKRPDSSLKPKLTAPVVVCRKRSSITAKAAVKGSNPDSKKSRDSFPLINKKKGKSLVNEPDTKPKKKKKLTEAEEKKQSAAKFLNRMKRSNEPSECDGGRDGGCGGDGKRDQAGKKSSGGHLKEQGSPGKRSVGRLPKRAAAPPPLAAVSGKRNRESVDSELGLKQTKKRSRR